MARSVWKGPYIVEGISYPSLPKIAKEYGITDRAIFKRYSRGKRGDELVPKTKLKNYVKPKKKYKHYFLGIGYNSIIEVLNKNNIDRGTYDKRINSGWTQLQALGLEKRKKTNIKRKYTHKISNEVKKDLKDLGYESLTAIAKSHNIKKETIFNRIYQGMDLKTALNKNVRVNKKNIIYKDKQYDSLADLCRTYNRDYNTVQGQLLNGYTLSQALLEEIRPTSNSLTYKGKVYKDIRDLADKYNINYKTLRGRIQTSKMPIEDALDLGNKKLYNQGRFNKKVLIENPELAETEAYLYFISFLFNGKERFKIGITTKSVKSRLDKEGFEFKIITIYKSKLMDCFTNEQNIIKNFENYRDKSISAKDLDGHTEVFNLDEKSVLKIKKIIELLNRKLKST